MNKAAKLIFFLIALTIFSTGCQENTNHPSPTKGEALVEVDSAIIPIVLKEKDAFDSLYVNAKIDLKYVSPLTGMVDLLNNKIKMFVSPRYFNKSELDFINKEKLGIKIFKFCYDPVVVITSKNNNLKQIRVDELKDALLGKIPGYKIVLPGSATSTFQYIKENILDGNDPKRAEILRSEKEVLKKIENSSDALGIINLNTIQDSSGIKFIQLGELNRNSDSTKSKSLEVNYFTPHPGFVIKNYYPLKQTVYIYLNEIELSPASGFTTFLTSYEGQKIALQENLAPAAVPVKINEYQ